MQKSRYHIYRHETVSLITTMCFIFGKDNRCISVSKLPMAISKSIKEIKDIELEKNTLFPYFFV